MRSIAILVLAALSAPGWAGDPSLFSQTGIYAIGGSGGIGLGVTKNLYDRYTLRGEWSSYSVDRAITEGDVTYDGRLKLQAAALYVDYHPFEGSFRLTAGLSLAGPRASMEGRATGGTITLNGNVYDATGEYVKAKVEYPSVMPYLGLGWGYRPSGKPGMMWGVDLGVFFGRTTASVTFSPGLVQAATQAGHPEDLALEEQKFKDAADGIPIYPLVKVGIGYSF